MGKYQAKSNIKAYPELAEGVKSQRHKLKIKD
jgi:hypothetical protein